MRAGRRLLGELRPAAARAALRAGGRLAGRPVLTLDYPLRLSGPRYGYGNPPHARILEILRRHEDAYRRNLATLASYRDDLLKIGGTGHPPWKSAWQLGMDVVALYAFTRSRAPGSYVEVGSGVSTMWVRRAIEDGGLETTITSIDPAPRVEVEALCDRGVRSPLEAADLSLFEGLGAGDVLFMDGSHRVFTNSDATVFFLDVLPELAPGVLVGVHDILLPDDYLPQWTGFHWSEQYLMAAYLLGGGHGIELELACHYATEHSDLHRLLDPLWESPQLSDVDRRGFGLWFSTVVR